MHLQYNFEVLIDSALLVAVLIHLALLVVLSFLFLKLKTKGLLYFCFSCNFSYGATILLPDVLSVEKSPWKYFMEELYSGNSLRNTTTLGNDKERERVYDTMFRLPWRCELVILVLSLLGNTKFNHFCLEL